MHITFGTLLITTLVLALVATIVLRQNMLLTTQREKQQQMQAKQEMMQAGIETQLQTLKTINLEIHDNIGQVLSLAKINLNTIPLLTDELAKAKVDHTTQLLGKAIRDIREISRRLVDDRIAKHGLQYAIESELQVFRKLGNYEIEMAVSGENYSLGNQQEVILFRILQDALVNAMKYSKGNAILVQIKYAPGKYSLTIHSKAGNIEEQKLALLPISGGLNQMGARAAMIGGNFSLLSTPEQGTTISIDICTPITS